MHVELSIEIPAPPDRVWTLAQDPALRPEWDQRIASYTWLGPIGAGTEIAMVLRMGLLRPAVKGRMLRWNPPCQSVVQVYEAASPLAPVGAGSWTFEALEGGGSRWTTRFTLRTEQLPWWVPHWLYRHAVYWDTWRSLRRLRALVMREVASGGT